MEDGKFRFPHDGYETLTQIIQGYLKAGNKPATLDDISSRTGLHRSIVSRNGGFLVDIGVLTPGQSKELTPEGRSLAVAISNDLNEDIATEWKTRVTRSLATRGILEMLQIRRSIAKDDLGPRIASTAGTSFTGRAKTGISTVVEIFNRAGLLTEEDGNYRLVPDALDSYENGAEPAPPGTPTKGAEDSNEDARSGEASGENPTCDTVGVGQTLFQNSNPSIPIHLNIELHLPVTSEQEVYDALFRSIRENLIEPYEKR